jgi:hypothetical protein
MSDLAEKNKRKKLNLCHFAHFFFQSADKKAELMNPAGERKVPFWAK